MKLQSFAENQWVSGSGTGKELLSAVDGGAVASISSDGIDFPSMLNFARDVGGPNLRKHTFHKRALMLKDLAIFLGEHKESFYQLSTQTGATHNDSLIDIDGGISTLFVFSGKGRREMPNGHVYLDGAPEMLSRNGTFASSLSFRIIKKGRSEVLKTAAIVRDTEEPTNPETWMDLLPIIESMG